MHRYFVFLSNRPGYELKTLSLMEGMESEIKLYEKPTACLMRGNLALRSSIPRHKGVGLRLIRAINLNLVILKVTQPLTQIISEA
jgi:hypothetical protein